MSSYKPNLEFEKPAGGLLSRVTRNRVKPVKKSGDGKNFHDFDIKLITDEVVNLKEFCDGKATVVMLVSHNPMNPQHFKDISHLALSYDDMKVLVVPAKDIYNEETLDNREILDVYSQLGCFVPITEKMTVNGRGRAPVLKYLFDCSVFGDH